MSKSTEAPKLRVGTTGAVGLAALAGARSMVGPALLSYVAKQEPRSLEGTLFAWVASRRTTTLFALMAAGEMLVDKLPIAPDRVAALPLMGRMGWGAFVGAAGFAHLRKPPVAGAVAGALAAGAAALATYQLRRKAIRDLHLPNPVAGLVEDAIVWAIGLSIVRSQGRNVSCVR